MQKTTERLNHTRVFARFGIHLFLQQQNIQNDPSYFQQRFPDCVISNQRMIIEETSARNFKVISSKQIQTFDPTAKQEELQIQYYQSYNFLIKKIETAIEYKDDKDNYLAFLEYEKRVLLIRIEGVNWRELEAITNQLNLKNKTLKFFTSVYLFIYPSTPTQADITNQVIPPTQPIFVKILGQ